MPDAPSGDGRQPGDSVQTHQGKSVQQDIPQILAQAAEQQILDQAGCDSFCLVLLRGLFWGTCQLFWWQQVDLPARGSVKAGQSASPDSLLKLTAWFQSVCVCVCVCACFQWAPAGGSVLQWSHPSEAGLQCCLGDAAGGPGFSSRGTKGAMSWFW